MGDLEHAMTEGMKMSANRITGRDLIAAGLTPGPQMGAWLSEANAALASGQDVGTVISTIAGRERAAHARSEAARAARRAPLRASPLTIVENITPESEDEVANVAAVLDAMRALTRTPTVEAAAVMPDACQAGAIPVGGEAAARGAIHPGWHSADICCSMSATNFGDLDPGTLLDAVHALTHFGPGGRAPGAHAPMPSDLADWLNGGNPFVSDAKTRAQAASHLMTQGDGNHFAFVGRSEATGETWLVTHHGSRGLGAGVYKAGMEAAERFRVDLCPDLDRGHAWIPADSDEGRAYWDALELVRAWTKANHDLLHDAVAAQVRRDPLHRRWNPHNFVFRDPADPDLFWHAKGATPVHNPMLADTDGTQIVPLNMAQPVLFIQGAKNDRSLGFAPHGAGRNLSRTQHKRRMAGETDAAIFARETAGIDARFFCGNIDISELPSAYKDADQVQRQMGAFGLATVTDRILPHGAIMAGDWERDAPWRIKARAKEIARAAERGAG